jgi:hypothetical protein
MYGESSKMKMRKMAMDSMMKEKPSLDIKSKKDRMMAEIDNAAAQDESSDEEDKGSFVSMMVTPEEKMMIMKMRKSGGMEEDMGDDEASMEA